MVARRSPATGHSRRREYLMPIAAWVLAGCTIERALPDDTVAVAAVESTSAAPADTSGGVADTSMEVAPPADTLASLAVPADRVAAPSAATRDTTPLVVTDAELRELAATLLIPVQGVRAAELRDTYSESRGTRVHEAIDILAPRNTPVLAATDGRVLQLHESVAGGLMVYAADASDRFVMMYGHLERYADGLEKGATLSRGQVIGYVGTSGNAPPGTPHLHFVIARGRPSVSWWRGTAVNPYPLLVGAGAGR